MRDTATHVKMVRERIRQRKRAKEKHRIFGLSAVCVLLSAVLAGMTGTLAGGKQTVLTGLYGSILLHEDAGGYVLVGVLAFSAAAVLTVFCIRFRETSRYSGEKQTETEAEKTGREGGDEI